MNTAYKLLHIFLAGACLNHHANYQDQVWLKVDSDLQRWINHAIHSFEKAVNNYARSKLLQHSEWLSTALSPPLLNY